MIQPDFLKKGDTIGIISPAGIIEENCFKTGVETLKKAGFSVKKGNHVIEKWNKFAGKDEERASDLINMIKDASVKAILCSRGGYGTMRIIEKTDFNTFKNHPKWIIGFSDITTLHNICHNLAIQSIHGPMCKHLQDKESLNSLLNILTGQENTLHLPSHQFNKEGITEGIIVGGNLSIMNSLLCTPYDI